MAEMKKYGYKAPALLMFKVGARASDEYETVTAVIIRALKNYTEGFDFETWLRENPDSPIARDYAVWLSPAAREVERVGS